MTSWTGPAVSKISEWLVASAVTSLIETAYKSYLCDRRLSDDSEAELKRLSTALPKITAVMDIAEALKKKDPSTGLWVNQFRQAVEESQLVLNELDYQNRDEAGESASSSKKRKRCIIINDDTMKRLKNALTMTDRATAEIDHLLRLATVLGVRGRSESQQEAGEVLRLEKQVFGWEVVKHKIFDWLKQPIDAWHSSFGTAGVSGIGNITLTAIVHKNMDGSNYFNKTICIRVCTDFSVQVTKTKILVKLGEKNYFGKLPLNVLQAAWKEKIHLKNIIIRGYIWKDGNHRDLQAKAIVDQILIQLRANYPLAEKMIGDFLIQSGANSEFLLETKKYGIGFKLTMG